MPLKNICFFHKKTPLLAQPLAATPTVLRTKPLKKLRCKTTVAAFCCKEHGSWNRPFILTKTERCWQKFKIKAPKAVS